MQRSAPLPPLFPLPILSPVISLLSCLICSAMKKKAPGSDAKFFTTNRKGENHELREELRSPDRNRKRDAVKKVSLSFDFHSDLILGR